MMMLVMMMMVWSIQPEEATAIQKSTAIILNKLFHPVQTIFQCPPSLVDKSIIDHHDLPTTTLVMMVGNRLTMISNLKWGRKLSVP